MLDVTILNKKKITQKEQITQSNEGYELMKANCYACHNPYTETHDNVIAPPMIAVKRMHSMKYTSKESFVNAVVAWASDPKEENALMRGAVMTYKVMPKQAFKEADLKKIEEPKWFAAHEKEMHDKGQGKGRGMMKKNQNN